MNHRCICRAIKGNTQRGQKRDVRQTPIFQLQTKTKGATEKYHSMIKQKTAPCNWEEVEDSLVKSIFIQGMRNPKMQKDWLSEDCNPIRTLQYALVR